MTAGPVVVGLLLASISLMLIDVRGGPTSVLRSLGQAVLGPVEVWADSAVGSLRVSQLRRPDTADLQAQLDAERAQNDALARERDQLAEQLTEARALARASQTVADLAGRTLTARVVAGGPAVTGDSLTISAGSADGVTPDSAVLAGPDLVGRVVVVGPTSSTVQLLTDPASSVAVRVNPARETALAVGSGDRHQVPLTLLDPLAEVSPGDRVVTMGSPDDAPFPAGLTVGTVATVTGTLGDLARTVTVQLTGDVTALDTVTVVAAPTDAAHMERRP
jgi:rod shape-determining protein MreC